MYCFNFLFKIGFQENFKALTIYLSDITFVICYGDRAMLGGLDDGVWSFPLTPKFSCTEKSYPGVEE